MSLLEHPCVSWTTARDAPSVHMTGGTSSRTQAPTSDNSTASKMVEKSKMRKPSCREENFPGTLELARASMCELDYCEGCSQCASLKSTTPAVSSETLAVSSEM